jgi:hypothetical protein
MAHLKHFGSNLLILGSECYADMYAFMILDQIGMSPLRLIVKWQLFHDMILKLI